MKKVNSYLFKLTAKYMLINLFIISIFILFLNLIEISRVLQDKESSIFQYLQLSLFKYPSILNEILPFVTIISIAFLFRNLINNNELISLRNIGYSIFDIFMPIATSVFVFGMIFLIIFNPISSNFEKQFQEKIKKQDQSMNTIKVSDNEMWIKNKTDEKNSGFINIKNIDLKKMNARNIKILLLKNNTNIFIQADEGILENNYFVLKKVKYYDIKKEIYNSYDNFDLKINFNKQNILNSITDYKLIPFYNYISHTKTLKKFNLYSKEIGLFYIFEILKPLFLVMLTFVVIGFSGKFRRNENFFKILFISILVGFLIFFLKEIINQITINLSLNFIISYLILFLLPFSFGLYQITKIEND